MYDLGKPLLGKIELKIDRTCTSGCCPRISEQEYRIYRFKSMSCRCPQFRGCFPSTDGLDDIDILLCNGKSTGVGSTILSVSVYLLPQCKYAKSVPLPLGCPGGIAMSAQLCPITDDLLYSFN